MKIVSSCLRSLTNYAELDYIWETHNYKIMVHLNMTGYLFLFKANSIFPRYTLLEDLINNNPTSNTGNLEGNAYTAFGGAAAYVYPPVADEVRHQMLLHSEVDVRVLLNIRSRLLEVFFPSILTCSPHHQCK